MPEFSAGKVHVDVVKNRVRIRLTPWMARNLHHGLAAAVCASGPMADIEFVSVEPIELTTDNDTSPKGNP